MTYFAAGFFAPTYFAPYYYGPSGVTPPSPPPPAPTVRSDGGFISRPRLHLPWYLDRTKAEDRVVKKIAKKIAASEPILVAEQLVSRAQGIMLSEDPGGAALATSALQAYEYSRDELDRIRAYWARVEEIVRESLEEEEWLLLLN